MRASWRNSAMLRLSPGSGTPPCRACGHRGRADHRPGGSDHGDAECFLNGCRLEDLPLPFGDVPTVTPADAAERR